MFSFVLPFIYLFIFDMKLPCFVFIFITASTSKAIGVQTERSIDFTKVELNNDLPSHLGLSETLLGIWGSTSEQQLGRNLISKLFMACPTDFQVLFGCMSMNMSSKDMDYLQDERSSHAALQYHMCSFPTSEAAKVSHLYSVLTKVLYYKKFHVLLIGDKD